MAEGVQIEIGSTYDGAGVSKAETELKKLFTGATERAQAARKAAEDYRKEIDAAGDAASRKSPLSGAGEVIGKGALLAAGLSAAKSAAEGILEAMNFLGEGESLGDMFAEWGKSLREWGKNLVTSNEDLEKAKQKAEKLREAQTAIAEQARQSAEATKQQRDFINQAADAADKAAQRERERRQDISGAGQFALAQAAAEKARRLAEIDAGGGSEIEKERAKREAESKYAADVGQIKDSEMVSKVESLRRELEGLAAAVNLTLEAGATLKNQTNVTPEQARAQAAAEEKAKAAYAAKEKEIIDAQVNRAREKEMERRGAETFGIGSAGREAEAIKRRQEEAAKLTPPPPAPGAPGHGDTESVIADAVGIAGRVKGRGRDNATARIEAALAKLNDGADESEINQLAKAFEQLAGTLAGRRESDAIKGILNRLRTLETQIKANRAND